MSTFKLTYSTMFNPPREMHERFDAAVQSIRAEFGKQYPIFIGGQEIHRQDTVTKTAPADTRLVLGKFSVATPADVDHAVSTAQTAFQTWRHTPWQERVALMRRVADEVEKAVYQLAAALSFEVGKNRFEALGEAAEVVEFFQLFADQMEKNNGYAHALREDPVEGFLSTNHSVLKPHGVWGVIVPFNFPLALAAGPTAAALISGNTVVLKGATETPWSGVLLARCLAKAGVPDGVFNYVLGAGRTVGKRLIEHEALGGLTFTGSYEVGMEIIRTLAQKAYPRPCIAEMGGKNAVIVTANADLTDAAKGIARSAYGLSGQKCSALSRIYVDATVADDLIKNLQAEIAAIQVGDPQAEATGMGPIATQSGFDNFAGFVTRLRQDGGQILAGGQQRWTPELEHGFYCQPTLAEAPLNHPVWHEEMFAPIAMLARVDNKEQALALVNDSPYGLTAGFYGTDDEAEWFYDRVEVGVAYSNRPQGATTGAWPGYQAFGGWKGSGSTGKALASFYYLPQYMREQSQTRVKRLP